MAIFQTAALALFSFCGIDALIHNIQGSDDGIVCLSISAYENEEWIDALLQNAIYFAEPSTRIVLHLSADSSYTEETLAKWETERITLSRERIRSRPFSGSLFYAHMLNAEHMDHRWSEPHDKPCAYWAYQASNMMWVRRGFEEHIRRNQFGMIFKTPEPWGCAKGVPFIVGVGSESHIYGWGRPESAYYPMDAVRGFLHRLQTHLEMIGDDGFSIRNAKCFLEELAMQTWFLNWRNVSRDELQLHKQKQLTWFNIDKSDKQQDSVPLDEVKAVVAGEKGWETYFAVKRVNRDVKHPTTAYIMSLMEK